MKKINVWQVTFSDGSNCFFDDEDWAIDAFVETVVEDFADKDASIASAYSFNHNIVKEIVDNKDVCRYEMCKIIKLAMPEEEYKAIEDIYNEDICEESVCPCINVSGEIKIGEESIEEFVQRLNESIALAY